MVVMYCDSQVMCQMFTSQVANTFFITYLHDKKEMMIQLLPFRTGYWLKVLKPQIEHFYASLRPLLLQGTVCKQTCQP